jgi:CO dehydrogenase maturation factor
MISVRPLRNQRIGVFGKGGSGKSTVTVLTARALLRQGYSVSVLDADSTNVGLHNALGIKHPPASLLEYYGGTVFSGGSVSCPVDDPTRLPGAHVSLEAIPDRYIGRTSDGIRLLIAGKLGSLGPGAGCDGPVAKIARDLTLLSAAENPVTLVDIKAGFEDAARGLITGVDWAIAVVDPTKSAVRIAEDLSNLVYRLHEGGGPATEHLGSPDLVELANSIYRHSRVRLVLTVLNRIADGDTEQLLREALLDYGIEPVAVIHEDPAISASWFNGGALRTSIAERDADPLVSALEAAAKTSLVQHATAPEG